MDVRNLFRLKRRISSITSDAFGRSSILSGIGLACALGKVSRSMNKDVGLAGGLACGLATGLALVKDAFARIH